MTMQRMTVKFLPICTKTNPCMDRKTGGITVVGDIDVALNGKEIIATIDIADDADAVDFDIAVSSSSIRGRGGKGTTFGTALFTVKKKLFACGEVFVLSDSNNYNCNCMFTLKDQTGQQGTPPALIWTMQDDCTTSETLVIEQFEVLSANTNPDAELTAVEGFDGSVAIPFNGSAVVAAQGHRAKIFNFNIHIDDGVDAGCGPGQLRSAIGFVLDSDSPDPNLDKPFQNTWWVVWNSTISTSGPALCHAMEFSRTPDYMPDPKTIEGRVNIHSNVIMADSFTTTGILFRGFGPVNTFLNVSRNTIIGAAAAGANAIQFGPILGEGTVERNLISFGDDTGVGVLVVGDGMTTDVAINQNDVEGGSIGVLVDKHVVSATIKSNILTGGTANTPGDIGVCTDADNDTLRANKIKDYNVSVSENGCTAMAQPAPD